MSGLNEDDGITLIDPAWIVPGSDYVTAVAWSSDGARLAAAFADGAIRLLEPVAGATVHELAGHAMGTLTLTWSPEGSVLASGGQDGQVRLWDGETGREIAVMNGRGAWVEHLAWSRRGHLLAAVAGRSLRVWNEDGANVFEVTAHASTITGLAWLRDGRRLATACYGGVSLWKMGQSRPEQRFDRKGSLLCLGLSPNDQQIAAGCQDASLIVWNVKTGKSLGMTGYPGKITRLAWDSRSRFLASGAGSDAVVWDFSGNGPARSVPRMLSRHVDRIVDLRFHPRRPVLATAGDKGMLVIWQLPQGEISHLTFFEQPLSVLAWHPTGAALAVGSAQGEVALLQLA